MSLAMLVAQSTNRKYRNISKKVRSQLKFKINNWYYLVDKLIFVNMEQGKRQLKVSKLLLKDLGDIFQRDNRGILEGAFVTVADVQITPDLSLARVYLSMMLVKDRASLIDRINARKSEIRRILGNKIGKQVRIIPDLVFYIDEVEEKALRMDQLIDQLNIPPSKEEDTNNE